MIVNDTSVRRCVKYLGTTVSRQVVHTLVDIFVEADDPLQVLKCVLSNCRYLQVRFRSDLRHPPHIIARLLLHNVVTQLHAGCCNHCFERTYFKFLNLL